MENSQIDLDEKKKDCNFMFQISLEFLKPIIYI